MKSLIKLLLFSGFTLAFSNQVSGDNSELPANQNYRFPDCEEIEWSYCDPNQDGDWLDILDIVFIVYVILGFEEPTDSQLCASDFNGDEIVDVLDVVTMVNMILEE